MLTKQENRVAGLVSVGYSDKEAADVLCVSTRTVVNHKQNIFTKLGISKSTELSAWYWCRKFDVKFDLSEIKKQAIAVFFLTVLLPSSIDFDHNLFRRSSKSGRHRTECRLRNDLIN